jgi:hypothetical protein
MIMNIKIAIAAMMELDIDQRRRFLTTGNKSMVDIGRKEHTEY